MHIARPIATAATVCLLFFLFPQLALADAMQRLRLDRLRATHAAIAALADIRREVDLPDDGYLDTRAVLHAHSHFSHDSNGSIEEIVAAANEAGVRVVMFSEHPDRERYDYFTDGHRGERDGVLLIPGAETSGFLVYPTRSIQDEPTESPQELADLVRRDDGLVFLCHLEERMDWEIAGLTGSEIYNTHADVMEEKQFMSALRSPLTLLSLLPALQQFPQETFGAILDYPTDYLRRWDELCQVAPHTGIGANDAHHNQGIRAYLDETGLVQIEDALGKQVASLDPEKVGLLRPLIAGKMPGDTVLELDLDPYERSFRHVSTHLLLPEVTRDEVWQALQAGRAYVSFDWLGDPTGFRYVAQRGDRRWQMGAELTDSELSSGADDGPLELVAAAPLPGLFKLVRDGEVIGEERSANFRYEVTEPGIYRLEVWLIVAEELRPWILSNPIYIRSVPGGAR